MFYYLWLLHGLFCALELHNGITFAYVEMLRTFSLKW